MEQIIEKIMRDVEQWREGALSVISMTDSAEVVVCGKRLENAMCAGYLKKGNDIMFQRCSKNFGVDGSHEEFMLIVSKGKKDLCASFALLDRAGIIISSDQWPDEDVEGFFWVGFSDTTGPHTALLTVYIKDGVNNSTLIIDADAGHCDSISRLAIMIFKGAA